MSPTRGRRSERQPGMRFARAAAAHPPGAALAGLRTDRRRVRGASALGRSRGNARAVLEDRLAWRLGVRQNLGVDVDDDLMALARGAGIDSVMEGRSPRGGPTHPPVAGPS